MGYSLRSDVSASRADRARTSRSCLSPSSGGRGCTLCTCFSACREGRACTQRSCFSRCREDTACTPRTSISRCRAGTVYAPCSCISPFRAYIVSIPSFARHDISRARAYAPPERRGRCRSFISYFPRDISFSFFRRHVAATQKLSTPGHRVTVRRAH
jgi:hypothetical protein